MNPNSAHELVVITQGTDYTPTEQFVNHNNPNSGPTSPPGPLVSNGLNSPVFALLCTSSTGAGNIKLRALGNNSDITIPAAAFKQGVVYYLYLKKLVDDGGGAVTFVGYKYKQYPMVL